MLRRRLADRSAARPLAFARVVVLAAGVFTLFSVCYFMVLVAGEAAAGSVATRSVLEVHVPPLTGDD